jgi:heme-degrading monooxygenase HmoA
MASTFHLAQFNIARIRAPLDDPQMKGFVDRLAELNALAERSSGFVWRLQTPAGDATYLRPYDDDRIIVNMSVWETVEALKQYVYKSGHADALRQRREWFESFAGAYVTLWWVPAGHRPGLHEAKQRLTHLEAHGPSQFAFTFKQIFEPDEEFIRAVDYGSFLPCPA